MTTTYSNAEVGWAGTFGHGGFGVTAATRWVLVTVPLADITAVPDRRVCNQEKISRYAACLDDLPPVLLGPNFQCWNGAHRLHAHRLRGRATIRAYVPHL